jgi:hypothetical protein
MNFSQFFSQFLTFIIMAFCMITMFKGIINMFPKEYDR